MILKIYLKNLSSDLALQRKQLQNSQQQKFLLQPQENVLPATQLQQQAQLQAQQQPQQQQQNQQQQLQQQQLQFPRLVQPQNKFSPQQLNFQSRSQFNRRQPQVRHHQPKSNNQQIQCKQEMIRPQLQPQPAISLQQNQQFNFNNNQNPKHPQAFHSQNRLPNNNQANFSKKNYVPYQNNLQPNSTNYRPIFQTYSQYPTSQQIPLLRQPLFHHNTLKNPISTAPPLVSPPSPTS